MTACDRGDVVLVPFPFTDARTERRRPALVISTPGYHAGCADCIVAMVTSRIEAPRRPGDHLVRGWKAAGLLHPSVVRAKITTISRHLARGRIGRLPADDLDEFIRGLAAVIGVARRDEV
jgi:mRNA interferase MazF